MNDRLVKRAHSINWIWSLIGRLILPRRSPTTSPQSIVIFDTFLIGDLVMLLPLLRALREAHKTAHIALVAGPWAAPIIAGEGLVDEHIAFSAPWAKKQSALQAAVEVIRLIRYLRARRWDWAIEIRGDVRPIFLAALSGAARRIGFAFTGGEALLTDIVADDGQLRHLVEHHQRIAEHLGVWPADRDYVPGMHLTASETSSVAAVEPYIGFHFGASMALRRLPLAEAAELINSFEHAAEPLILFEAPDAREYNAELREHLSETSRNRLQTWSGSLRDFVVMASRAQRIFAMDSGPAHIAAALGVPTTVFFGPNRPEYTAPLGANVSVIEVRDLPCRPCQNVCTNQIYQACLSGVARLHRMRNV
jgi:ADP-heptose:LPS heptosyltransferase